MDPIVVAVIVVFTPILCCWAMLPLLLQACQFLNHIRDTLLLGRIDSHPITPNHRRVLTWDWMISAAGILLACSALYSLFDFGSTFFGGPGDTSLPQVQFLNAALNVLKAVPVIFGAGFVLCGIADLDGIRRASASAETR